jgi:copper chaperone
MRTLRFKTNINCSGCVKSVTPHLNNVKGIDSWKVDTETPDKVLTIETENETSDEVKVAVQKAGFNIEELN